MPFGIRLFRFHCQFTFYGELLSSGLVYITFSTEHDSLFITLTDTCCIVLFLLGSFRQQLGPSCLGGVAVIITMVPLNKVIAAWMGRLQKRLMKARDRRTEINNEVLGSMKVIKLQAVSRAPHVSFLYNVIE